MFAQFNVCTISLQGLPNMYKKTYQLKMNEIVYVNYFPLISYHWFINVLKVWPVHMD